jgi:hypothetical protein
MTPTSGGQNRQLTIQESRNRLARKICHGNRGQIHQPCREGQEDQLAALGLVLNAVVLWNTHYLDAIVGRVLVRRCGRHRAVTARCRSLELSTFPDVENVAVAPS